ncbi:MAG: MFS transporter [Candidatus Hodarchaeales archaeon]|jgi:MFS family permease
MNIPLRRFKVFFGLSSFQILAMFRRGLFYIYLSIYLRDFLGLSVTETTLFATLPMIMNVFCQMFIWGTLSDRYQLRRTFVIVGEISASISTLIVFFLHRAVSTPINSGWVIILGLSFVEIAWSMSNTGWSALISDLYSIETRQKIQGQLSSLGGVGRIIGIFVGGMLYDGLKTQYEGWGFYEGPLFYIAAAIMLVSTIPMLFTPEGGISKPEANRRFDSTQKIESVETRSQETNIFTFFLVAILFINFGRNALATTFSPYMVLDSGFDISSELLSYLINFQSFGIIILGIFVGRIGFSIGNGYSTLLGTIIGIFAILIIAFSSYLPLIFIASFLRGVGDVLITASSYAFASELISPEKRAKGFSYFNATFFLSFGMAGTFLTGPIVDISILLGIEEVVAYRLAFLTASVVVTIGFFILFRLVRKKSKS